MSLEVMPLLTHLYILGVCNSGVCMLSCGKTRRDRKADIENILGPNNYTSSSGDEFFCPPCKGVANEDKKAAENDLLEMEMSDSTSNLAFCYIQPSI